MTTYPIAGYPQSELRKRKLTPTDAVVLRAFSDAVREGKALKLEEDGEIWYDVPYEEMFVRTPAFLRNSREAIRMRLLRLAAKGVLEGKKLKHYQLRTVFRLV